MTDPTAELVDLDGVSVSVLAVERGGDVIAARDPDRALAPASNTKLVTAALALDVLGPDYRFETRAVGDGTLDGDCLDGDLVLEGRGAPDLSSADVDELAADVAEQVSAVDGDLLLDATRFAGGHLGPGWTWGDEQYAYGARSSALAVDRNVVEVRVSDPNGTGGFDVEAAPDSPVVAVEADLDRGEADLRVLTDHETGAIRVEGTLPPGTARTERAPVARPERHCGAVFRDALDEAGVALDGTVRSAGADPPRDPSFSCRVASAPVADLIREMNVPSDNFVAEQLARTVASRRGDGSWEAWNEVATGFLSDRGAGACRITDGSGLSRYNLATARGLVGLLARAGEAPWGEAFFESLPAPGEGTLEERLGDVDGVAAKTGTITGTSALSGVLERDGEPDVLFSVLMGGLAVDADEARRRQDAFVRALA